MSEVVAPVIMPACGLTTDPSDTQEMDMQRRHPTATSADTIGIDPRILYTRAGFIRASGIAQTRIREARLMGIQMPVLRVGKRHYIRGADAIAFIERLAEATAGAAGDDRQASHR